ncbi:MAG: sugar transferase [Geobacter sp.]|nr:MAG: sugar transferase [Geobacter sp.]
MEIAPRGSVANGLRVGEAARTSGNPQSWGSSSGETYVLLKLPIPVKVELDEYYLKHYSLSLDLRILFITALKVLRSDGVTH